MTPSTEPVLVAGGGPSGLVTALALLQNNIPVRIIDKESNYRLGQRGSGLFPRTFEVFHFLGVHEIHRRATPVLPIREYKPGTLEPTKTFAMATQNDPTPSIPYNNPMLLGQPTLESVLRSHLTSHGCSVELGTELQTFEDDGERVLAKLVKRRDGGEVYETFVASYLIGVDGAKGVSRKQLGLTLLGETMQKVSSVVGDICIEMEGIDRKHWHFFGNRPSSILTLRPTDEIGPDGFHFMMHLEEYESKQLIADKKLMIKCMSELLGREINVRKIDFVSEYRPNNRMVDRFGAGRVYIAGDAAHVHSSTGAQGLNTCVQDAFNLAWKLSLVYRGFSPVTLLDTYTTERLPVIAEMLNIITGILHRKQQAPTLERVMERGKRMNMLGVNYRTSPIVVDEFTRAEPVDAYGVLDEGVLVAGDRAPDAPGLVVAAGAGGPETDVTTKAETRLFDVFSAVCHTVLVFAPGAASTDILDTLRRYPADVIRAVIVLPQGSEATTVGEADVVIDHAGHAYQGYLVEKGEKKVVVVRPDGVVGAIVHGVEGLETYFGKVFI